jgi:hypothetical protein
MPRQVTELLCPVENCCAMLSSANVGMYGGLKNLVQILVP